MRKLLAILLVFIIILPETPFTSAVDANLDASASEILKPIAGGGLSISESASLLTAAADTYTAQFSKENQPNSYLKPDGSALIEGEEYQIQRLEGKTWNSITAGAAVTGVQRSDSYGTTLQSAIKVDEEPLPAEQILNETVVTKELSAGEDTISIEYKARSDGVKSTVRFTPSIDASYRLIWSLTGIAAGNHSQIGDGVEFTEGEDLVCFIDWSDIAALNATKSIAYEVSGDPGLLSLTVTVELGALKSGEQIDLDPLIMTSTSYTLVQYPDQRQPFKDYGYWWFPYLDTSLTAICYKTSPDTATWSSPTTLTYTNSTSAASWGCKFNGTHLFIIYRSGTSGNIYEALYQPQSDLSMTLINGPTIVALNPTIQTQYMRTDIYSGKIWYMNTTNPGASTAVSVNVGTTGNMYWCVTPGYINSTALASIPTTRQTSGWVTQSPASGLYRGNLLRVTGTVCSNITGGGAGTLTARLWRSNYQNMSGAVQLVSTTATLSTVDATDRTFTMDISPSSLGYPITDGTYFFMSFFWKQTTAASANSLVTVKVISVTQNPTSQTIVDPRIDELSDHRIVMQAKNDGRGTYFWWSSNKDGTLGTVTEVIVAADTSRNQYVNAVERSDANVTLFWYKNQQTGNNFFTYYFHNSSLVKRTGGGSWRVEIAHSASAVVDSKNRKTMIYNDDTTNRLYYVRITSAGVAGTPTSTGVQLDTMARPWASIAPNDDIYVQWVDVTNTTLKYVKYTNATSSWGTPVQVCTISGADNGNYLPYSNYTSNQLGWVYASDSTTINFFIHSLAGGNPANDALSVSLSSTDNLYPLKTYLFDYDGHDDSGAYKVTQLLMNFTDGGTVVASFKYVSSTRTFSVPVGGSTYSLVTSSCSDQLYENWVNVTFAVKAYSNVTEHEDLSVKCIVTDGSTTDTDTLLTGLDVQKTLTVSSISASDNPIPAPGSTQLRATALFGSGGTASDFVAGDFIRLNGTVLPWNSADNRFETIITQTGPTVVTFSALTASYLLASGNFTGTVSTPYTLTWYTPVVGGGGGGGGGGFQTGASTQTDTGTPIPITTDIPVNWLAQNGQVILLIILAATFGIWFLTPKSRAEKRNDGLNGLLPRPGKASKKLGKWWRKVVD